MIEILPETGGKLIAVKMSGTVTEEQQNPYFEEAAAIFARERVENLLLDWSDLDGWEQGARSAGTWFGLHHRALIGRIAILAPERWDDESLRIADIFNAATVRRFSPADRAQAIVWLTGD
jgi:hypothetical protein